ncbi:uncharacterized protein LOC141632411 [Silene latifolia]|uniref:uncharacterized protein LOC141632411 n=1 Tax=Silene latifolia TaxID=37657 RepID=UPI003D77E4F2
MTRVEVDTALTLLVHIHTRRWSHLFLEEVVVQMVTVSNLQNLMNKIGFWNVRGMNRVGKQKAIIFFLHNKEIRLFGLLETKIKSMVLKKVVNNFNNWCISTNNGHHNGGRIWILWQPQAVKVQFLEYNAQFIHMRVESLGTRSIFYMTMVYAFNSIHDRAPLWDHLRRIASHVSGPWAIAGDFNCVLSAVERVGGNTPSGEMGPFRQCVADCGVIDIDATGSLFTWNNKQKPEDRIYSTIDRFLINKDWCDHMPDLYAHFLPEGLMDHTPCIVSSSKNSQRKRCFKYFNMWGDTKEFLPTVRSNLDKDLVGTSMFRLAKTLKNLKPALKRLNKEGYNDIEHSTRRLQKQVHDLQEQLGRNPTDIQLLNAQ